MQSEYGDFILSPHEIVNIIEASVSSNMSVFSREKD